MRLLGWLATVWLVLAVTGCAAPQIESQNDLVLKQRQGKFSVQTQLPNAPIEAIQGNFVWRHLDKGWQLDLQSPLGSTLARLTVSAAGATLETPDAPTQRAVSGEELLAGVLGAPVPLDVLEDWIDGRVLNEDKVTNVKRDAQGRIVSFNQSGWLVSFDRYGEYGPARVSAQGKQQDRLVTLRLVADQPL